MIQSTPKSNRLHIAFFGRTNVGKSSIVNCLADQDISITSDVPGTTTDVVEKAIELLPVGPVLLIDTAGLDDESILGSERVRKTQQVFHRADVVVLVTDGAHFGDCEEDVLRQARERNLPVIVMANKSDIQLLSGAMSALYESRHISVISCIAIDPVKREQIRNQFKTQLLQICPDDFMQPPPLVSDLVPPGRIIMLVVPIDLQAPKGRLILPQVQTIRDALDGDAAVMVVKEREYAAMLRELKTPPALAVCDSQVVQKMVADTPPHVPCTTFSILFARIKGDLRKYATGAVALERLKDGDQVLIAESCSHHPLEDDIGRVKIPRWIRQYTGASLKFDHFAGRDFPENLADYKLAVQCGGCMHNRREMLSRIQRCENAGVSITNYGVCISATQGVLKRVLSPFPSALQAWGDEMGGTSF